MILIISKKIEGIVTSESRYWYDIKDDDVIEKCSPTFDFNRDYLKMSSVGFTCVIEKAFIVKL